MESLMRKVSRESESFRRLDDETKLKILSGAENLAVGEPPATAGLDDMDRSGGEPPNNALARFILEGVPGIILVALRSV